jgi:hypothetical protein
LPADLPEALEIEYRRHTADGDDLVLKLTPAGARYGWARGKARVALRASLPAATLAGAYATLRREGFDRLETVPGQVAAAAAGGTSLRLAFGEQRHTVIAMGGRAPAPDAAEAYARCVAAMEQLLPTGRSDVVVSVRWDVSMRDRTAGLDVDVGADLVGLHRVRPPGQPRVEQDGETVELHLARPRALQLQLRQSGVSPTTLTVHAGQEPGIELAFDAPRGEVVARPLAVGSRP